MIFYLLGFMGVGKTYYGKHWSAAQKLPFIDLDALIEKKEEMSIADIFKQKGEAHFRAVESKYLRGIQVENAIVACGGGTPCHNDNMAFMLQSGTTIWLDASAEYIVHRLQNGIDKRPLLQTDNTDIFSHVESLMAARESCYAKADYRLIVTEEVEHIAQQIFLDNA